MANRKKKKKGNLKWKNISILLGILAGLVTIIILVCVLLFTPLGSKVRGDDDNESTVETNEDSADLTAKKDNTIDSSNQSGENNFSPDSNSWELILVNPTHPLPDNFNPDLSVIKGNLKFDSRAIDKLNQMVSDCNAAGYNLWVQSSFRDRATQTRLYNNEVAKQKGKGLSEDMAKEAAAKVVAIPGTSEHNTGLAVDFNNVEDSFENTKASKWLKENAYKYGFILRYEKEKESITKVVYEPWHYRYVGVENATKIHEQGITLEEYLNVLN